MQPLINYIIIDDELIDRITLSELLRDCAGFSSKGVFEHALDAFESLKGTPPHLIFIDIDMPTISGLDFIRKIKEWNAMVVFVTAHPEYALEGFELSAIDYIVKPATSERLAMAVKRIEELWEMKQHAAAYKVLFQQDSLLIKDGHINIKIPMHEIIYLEAMQDYTKLVTATKDYLTLATLTSFTSKLPAEKFVRIHRSYMVAVGHVSAYDSSKVTCGNRELPIGKTYKVAVKNYFV